MNKKQIYIEHHRVPVLTERKRLQEYAVGIFQTISTRKGIKKAIKRGRVYVDNEMAPTGLWIVGGEEICLTQPNTSKKPKLEIDLNVLYEDDFLAVVYKPAGILVSGNKRYTVENALSHNLNPSSRPDALARPEPIHRLDYPTTGALLVGKTGASVVKLNAMFELKQIDKTYLGVTVKNIDAQGSVSNPIDGKAALSSYKKLSEIISKKYDVLSLVELIPHTGRRHQLRKHLSQLGAPLFGDDRYGIEGYILKGRGLYLHAYTLSFLHPFLKETITVKAPIPKKIVQLFPDLLAT